MDKKERCAFYGQMHTSLSKHSTAYAQQSIHLYSCQLLI